MTTASGYIVLALATAIGGGLLVILAVLVFELISGLVDSHIKAMGITFSIIATIIVAVSSVESIRTQFIASLPEPARAVITDFEDLIQPIIDSVENILDDLFSNEDGGQRTPPPTTVPASPTAVPTVTPTEDPTATETRTPTATATEEPCQVTTDLSSNGNVRSDHGLNASVIGSVVDNQTFPVINIHPTEGRVEWFEIRLANGTSGWVHWSLVDADPPNCG